ncbi:MAG: hypothetical protein R3300_18010, partial [Candidatus Promineifilaceae bacterium]|nr:hypothetical protein [Candidatus Promineifilaceae bacterium]
MNQLQTQRSEYWVNEFDVTDADIEQIYNHFLEVEIPQTSEQLTQVIIAGRVAQERNRLKKLLSGRAVYQPREQYTEGDELVFPALKYAQGTVEGVREGFEPQQGEFDVIQVKINGKQREFAAKLPGEHKLNLNDGETYDPVDDVDVDAIYEEFGPLIVDQVTAALEERSEFVRLSEQWFVKQLLAEVNIGHLHLTEAILEVSEGGPLPTEEILGQLDMDDTLKPAVLRFSLNYALANDPRFDEVGRPDHVAWYLRRLEPEGV